MAAGKLCFPPAPHNSTSVPDPKRLNYSLGEKLGYFVARYTGESLCDSFSAFQKQDYGVFFFPSLSFYLARQPSKWKVFLTFSIISAFNSPTVSHLPSFPSIPLSFSVFLQRRLFISALTIAGRLILFDVPRSLSDESIRDKRREKTPVRGMIQLLMQLSDKRCLRRNILPVLQKKIIKKIKIRVAVEWSNVSGISAGGVINITN